MIKQLSFISNNKKLSKDKCCRVKLQRQNTKKNHCLSCKSLILCAAYYEVNNLTPKDINRNLNYINSFTDSNVYLVSKNISRVFANSKEEYKLSIPANGDFIKSIKIHNDNNLTFKVTIGYKILDCPDEEICYSKKFDRNENIIDVNSSEFIPILNNTKFIIRISLINSNNNSADSIDSADETIITEPIDLEISYIYMNNYLQNNYFYVSINNAEYVNFGTSVIQLLNGEYTITNK
jgi:hypothetical protein